MQGSGGMRSCTEVSKCRGPSVPVNRDAVLTVSKVLYPATPALLVSALEHGDVYKMLTLYFPGSGPVISSSSSWAVENMFRMFL